MTEILFGLLVGLGFYEYNQDFFDKANEQLAKGYEWEFVGFENPDEKSKHISLWVPGNGKENDLVFFKLRTPE